MVENESYVCSYLVTMECGRVWPFPIDLNNETEEEYAQTFVVARVRDQSSLPTRVQVNDPMMLDKGKLWVAGECLVCLIISGLHP